MSGLQDILKQTKAALDDLKEVQQSPVVFNVDHVPDTVKHKSYRLAAGSIQSNAMSRADGAESLCSDKRRLLSVVIAARNQSHDRKIYDDLLRLEELIEKQLLHDTRTAGYFNALRDAHIAPDANNLFWIMELVFEFDYERTF